MTLSSLPNRKYKHANFNILVNVPCYESCLRKKSFTDGQGISESSFIPENIIKKICSYSYAIYKIELGLLDCTCHLGKYNEEQQEDCITQKIIFIQEITSIQAHNVASSIATST